MEWLGRSGSRLTHPPQFTGSIRKKMGFTFLGETRHGEHWVIADVRVKNMDRRVCYSRDFGFETALTVLILCAVLAYVG